jgi:hypothetical protein
MLGVIVAELKFDTVSQLEVVPEVTVIYPGIVKVLNPVAFVATNVTAYVPAAL